MKIYEPIAISLFTVLVLAASFLVGKSIGFEEGMSHAQSSAVSMIELKASNNTVR